MKKYLAKIGLGLMGLAFILPTIVSADGGVFPRPDYWIQETEQQAVIFYDQGVETMVVSTKFQGDTSDFAWIIPVPDKPEVTKGSTTLFTSLEELTIPNYGLPVDVGMSTKSMGMAEVAPSAVRVIEEKTIDYYDVKVISSTDKNELATWFNENGYHFPEKYSYILSEYINNGWYFVATKINNENVDVNSIGQSLKTGSATPLQITFKAKNMVFPM
jgi:hypothetical protein